MGVHLVFVGPSGSGKTTLMLGLSELDLPRPMTIDRTITTRPRRPYEGDLENRYVTLDEFEAERPSFLFTFESYGRHKYGMTVPESLGEREVRMRILRPSLALQFKKLVPEPVVICAVAPFVSNPRGLLLHRVPWAPVAELEERVHNFHDEDIAAALVADIHHQNRLGIEESTVALAALTFRYLRSKGL